MGITLDKILFNTGTPADSANVGAYLRDDLGNLITSTLIGADQALDVNIAGSTGLGIYDEDTAHVSGDKGQQILAVRRDADTTLAGTDGDYAPLQVDADGFLKVRGKITVEAGDAEYLEDSVHTNGDAGLSVFAVRQDVLSSLSSASGDYANFKSDALGRLWSTRAAQSAAYGAVSVTTTATKLIATNLVNRTRVIIQNLGNKDIFFGHNASVTAALGVKVSAGSSIEVEAGPQIDMYGITSASTADVRYYEVA